jgi:hypothetical protein
MHWGTAIFLTLLLTAIAWPLFQKSHQKNEMERSALVINFAETLSKHPKWMRKNESSIVTDSQPSVPPSHGSPVTPVKSGTGIRTLWSAAKKPPTHPHVPSNDSMKVQLNSSQDPLVFGSKSEWEQWIHDGIHQEGANFLDRISVDHDPHGYLATTEFIRQSERNPVLLNDVNRRAIELLSKILLDPQSPHHDWAETSLESLLRQTLEVQETRTIEKVLMEHRSRRGLPSAQDSQ